MEIQNELGICSSNDYSHIYCQSIFTSSTMSLLAKQLQQIKNNQRAVRVAPSQQQPTLLLDTHTASTTSHDLIYTLAIISYSKLLSQQAGLKIEGQTVMGSENRQINRNTLTKEGNRGLSQKLIKFMLKISPYFMGQDCQKVMQYLLHNFKVNIFQAQALAIIYLQYWNTPIYQKLITNIPQKILSIKLPFLTKLTSQQPHNLTFIVKSLAYSHYLLSSILLYTLQFIKIDSVLSSTMDIEINLGDELPEQRQNLVRCDPRRFLMQIFSQFINRKMVACYKYILQFCAKAIHTHKQNSTETCSMVMLLSTRLLLDGSISDQLLMVILNKLLKNSYYQPESQLKSVFDFSLIVWQRKPYCITGEMLNLLQGSDAFLLYLSKFKCSLWMVLVRLLELWCQGFECKQLLTIIRCRVKKDQFYILHGQEYHHKILSLLQKSLLSTDSSKTEFIRSFFQQNFSFQVASYYNKKVITNQQLHQNLIAMFNKQTLKMGKTNELIFNLSIIKKNKVAAQKQPVLVQQTNSQDDDESISNQLVQRNPTSLLAILRSRGLQLDAIHYLDSDIKTALLSLVNEYYKTPKQSVITRQQKNMIMQQYLTAYLPQMFQSDLQCLDFITAIKYLSQNGNVELSKKCLLELVNDLNLIDDVLFRELVRLSLQQLSVTLSANYKQTVYYLNTLFKKFMSKYIIDNAEPSQILKLSDMLLRISEQVFRREGIRKGKYHRLLHNHGRLIAELIIGIKNKKIVTKQIANDQKALLNHYIRILNIFGADNLYLLNIGIVQILTRKQLDHTHVRYFVSKLLLTIKQGALDFHALTFSLAKTIVFCSQLSNTIVLNQRDIQPSLCSGIAKSTIADFFGLVKDKFKRVIIKKLLLFIRSIFQSSALIQSFKAHLIELPSQNLQDLLSLFTEFYKILSLLSSNEANILKFRESIMDKITNIFPLDLRLVLFTPLLPNQQLYAYLAKQLQEHSAERSQFANLANVLNIVPESVSYEWVKLARQCMKRDNEPSQNLVSSVLLNFNAESNINNYSQFICGLAQYYPELIYPHLPLCIQILQKHCQKPDDFTLALISRLIKDLGQMIEPYLNDLILTSLSFDSSFTEVFISQVTAHLVPSTLIKLIKQNHKKATHFSNFSLFFKQVVIKGVGDSLNKTLLNFISRTIQTYLQSQEDISGILQLQASIFLQIGLKMNQNQLRKSIIDLVRWSEIKSQVQNNLPFNARKIIVADIYCLFQQNLQTLFNPFYGYTFEGTIKDYQSITKHFQLKQKAAKLNDLKRNREQPQQMNENLIQLYLTISLKSFELLFKNDVEHQFLDSVKIDVLGDPIADLILLGQFTKFSKIVSDSLAPCIVALHRCIADDYQMKTVNYKILLLLKKKNAMIQKHVFELVDKLVDDLQDRFLILVTDLVPFLLEWAGSRHEGIAKVVRRIIGKIEELSGEQIQNYAK